MRLWDEQGYGVISIDVDSVILDVRSKGEDGYLANVLIIKIKVLTHYEQPNSKTFALKGDFLE